MFWCLQLRCCAHRAKPLILHALTSSDVPLQSLGIRSCLRNSRSESIRGKSNFFETLFDLFATYIQTVSVLNGWRVSPFAQVMVAAVECLQFTKISFLMVFELSRRILFGESTTVNVAFSRCMSSTYVDEG